MSISPFKLSEIFLQADNFLFIILYVVPNLACIFIGQFITIVAVVYSIVSIKQEIFLNWNIS